MLKPAEFVMASSASPISAAHADALEKDGFARIPVLDPASTTIDVARRIGTVIDVGAHVRSFRVPSVQSLRPSSRAQAAAHSRYSARFGLDAFPLHTDLAHWSLPPRYLILRCVVPAPAVRTLLLPSRDVVAALSAEVARRAVFRTRSRRRGRTGLRRALSGSTADWLFRWDPIFLRPVNTEAKRVAVRMIDTAWEQVARSIGMCASGDTIIVDNWTALHGRSSVPEGSENRVVERAYLSEIIK